MKKKIKAFAGLIAISLLAAACTAAPSISSSNESAETGKKEVIKVGTMGTYEPFSYQDETGRLTGYDLEVLRAMEKYMPDYTFEFIASPWDTLFVGLESDRFQLLANQLARNETREEKYLISQNSYFNSLTQPIVRSDDDSIQSLTDLIGKKVGTTVGDSHTQNLERFNEENGSGIELLYYESDINTVLQDIVSGRIDATTNNPIMAKMKAEVLGLNIKAVDDVLVEDHCYFISKKDAEGEKLMQEIDAALSKIKEDGTLAELSVEWFGTDYTN